MGVSSATICILSISVRFVSTFVDDTHIFILSISAAVVVDGLAQTPEDDLRSASLAWKLDESVTVEAWV